MVDPEDICERFWSLPTKPEEESKRERLFLDDIIQKAHLDREIRSRLGGVRTVLDAGAGTGRFSIELAKEGLQVTHFDISPLMIDQARLAAEQAGVLDTMTFRRGRIGQLVEYADAQFDLVISTDAPVSYTYPKQRATLAELVRIAGKAIVISVSSRLGYLPLFFNPIQKEQYLVNQESEDPLVRFYLRERETHLSSWTPDFGGIRDALSTGLCSDPEVTEREYEAGKAPWPHNYLFMPDELATILSAVGVTDLRISGPGALSRGIPNAILKRLLLTDANREAFLDLCYEFDSNAAVCGLGKDNLVASGRIS